MSAMGAMAMPVAAMVMPVAVVVVAVIMIVVVTVMIVGHGGGFSIGRGSPQRRPSPVRDTRSAKFCPGSAMP